MANVINRTTSEILLSVHTPDYPVTDWIINPVNVYAMLLVKQGHRVIDNDTVRETNSDEKLVIRQEDLTRYKALARSIAAWCIAKAVRTASLAQLTTTLDTMAAKYIGVATAIEDASTIEVLDNIDVEI